MEHPIIGSGALLLAVVVLSAAAGCSLAQNSPQDYVAAHNAARKAVGVVPLEWNQTVAAYAQNYANQRGGDCDLDHSRGPYGENLAQGWGAFSGKEAVDLWLSEKINYNHNTNSCEGGECLHYTQVVWDDSVELGCARVTCTNGKVFVICNYYPPGNYVGESPY
ncbi:pathogenesis-related protein 1-like [Malania oleifera]|uniref:pathogenesis-related protein 1-like n=1 Tax=Malania oleifera TaxID=397392 RepID=UPI0025ADB4F0|nr:pathogenesis-related protein 1-like [Malania oleifera]